MKAAGALIVVATLAVVFTPAHAGPPIAVRAVVGVGPGGARVNGLTTGPFAGAFGVDLAWRDRPGHAYVLAYDRWSAGSIVYYIPETRRLESVDVSAMTVGLERGPKESASGGFFQITAGIGRMFPRESGPFVYAGGLSSLERNDQDGTDGLGFALTAQAAMRLAPPPNPFGFIVGFRTSHIVCRVGHAHSVLFEVGLTIHPQGGTDEDHEEPGWIEAARDVRNPSIAS